MAEKRANLLPTDQGLVVTLREIEPVARQLLRYYKDIERLSKEMERFERRYGLSSDEFYAKWKDGQLGDETDFFEWYAYCDTYHRVVGKVHRLGKELHDLLPDLVSLSPEGVSARVETR